MLAIIEEKDFQTKVLEGVESLDGRLKASETHRELLCKNIDQLSKDTKQAFEELTKTQKAVNDIDGVVKAIQKVNLQLKREENMAFGNPVERISRNDELREAFNALIRVGFGNQMGVSFTHADRWQKNVKENLVSFQRALGEDSSPGSTLIITNLFKEIYDTLARYGKWNTLGAKRVTTKVTNFPVKTARALANFLTTEAATISDDTAKTGTTIVATVLPIAALLNVSKQILDDAEFDVTADVMDDFVQAFNLRLDAAAFAGDGTNNGTYGAFTGIFNYGTPATAAAGNVTVAGTQLDDWVRCLYTVDVVVLQRPAKWWIHPFLLAKAILVKDRNGRPIFMNALEAPSSGVGSILGYPVEMVAAAPSTDAASAKIAVFGDPQSYIVPVRQDFSFDASDDFRWNTYERSFRGIGRAAAKGRIATGSAVLTLPAA